MEKNSHCSFCGSRFAADQTWPRTCGGCGNTSYLNPLPVAVLIVPVGEGILAVRRAIEPRRGMVALPGGFIGIGESWQAAGAREVWEEAGLRVVAEEVEDFCVLSAPDGTVLIFGVTAPPRAPEELPPFTPNEEASERVILTAPIELAFPLHTLAVRRFFAQRQGRIVA